MPLTLKLSGRMLQGPNDGRLVEVSDLGFRVCKAQLQKGSHPTPKTLNPSFLLVLVHPPRLEQEASSPADIAPPKHTKPHSRTGLGFRV